MEAGLLLAVDATCNDVNFINSIVAMVTPARVAVHQESLSDGYVLYQTDRTLQESKWFDSSVQAHFVEATVAFDEVEPSF